MHIKKVMRLICLTLVFGLVLTSGALSFAEEFAPEEEAPDAWEVAVPAAEVLLPSDATDATEVVYVKIKAAEGAVAANRPVSLFVSLANFTDINLVVVEFTFDADYLNIAAFGACTALNGLMILQAEISEIQGSMYKGKVTLAVPGSFKSSEDEVDIMRIDGVAKGKIGKTVVTLTVAEVYGKLPPNDSGEKDSQITAPVAEIGIVGWTPVFSKYDLNKGPIDGFNSVVDSADLAIAVYFYQMRSTNANWETPSYSNVSAKQADVNGSGVVNLADLIEIMANYGVYSTSPG